MLKTQIKVLNVPVNYAIAESIEEFDKLAGKEGAALAQANKQELYHGSFADIRSKVAELLKKEGHEREAVSTEDRTTVDEEGNETTESVVTKWETEAKFFDRICAEQGVEPSHFEALIQKAADSVPFDPSVKERSAKAKKVGKTHLEAAQTIADQGALETVAEKLAEKLDIEIDVSNPDTAIENLARAIGLNEAAIKRELAASYMSM